MRFQVVEKILRKTGGCHGKKIAVNYCILLYCMYFLLIWRKRSSTNHSLIKAKKAVETLLKHY